jgi:sugar/nucleoside kinase (ribokinase family)
VSDIEFDVVGVGASCIDTVCRLPVFPEPTPARDKVRMLSQRRECGGQTATCLSTCASFGLRAAYLGAIGSDEDGRMICRELTARGVDVRHVATRPQPSASATILIDTSGERLVLWHRDPGLSYPVEQLPRHAIQSARLVHVDDVDEQAALAAARCARESGVPVTCDIDHLTPVTRELLSYVTHPVFAAQVPLDLTGQRDHEAALRALRRTHPGILVVTLGDQGALALDGDTALRSPASTSIRSSTRQAPGTSSGARSSTRSCKAGRRGRCSASQTRLPRKAARKPAPWAAYPPSNPSGCASVRAFETISRAIS